MVGFDPSIKPIINKGPNISYPEPEECLEPLVPEFPDFSLPLSTSFDFDNIDDWILRTDCFGMPNEVNPCPNGSDSVKVEVVSSEGFHGVAAVEEVGREAGVESLDVDGSDLKMVEEVKDEDLGLGLASCIEAKMEEVSLVETGEALNVVNGDGVVTNSDVSECLVEVKVDEEVGNGVEGSLGDGNEKLDNVVLETDGAKVVESKDSDEDDESESSDEESEDASSSAAASSSSSSSSDEEEEEEKMVGVGEVEEGEIRDLVIDDLIDGSDDEDVGVAKGPIKSKNEIEVLPPVPNVDATLEPHHKTLPVGVILSVMGTKVIVEGVEQHNPLNEGSILWITESRSLLGLVDEIFGPVKNPYYVVRYNCEEDVPTGIHEGTPVSFVAEFADHVLNDKNLYKKGYDASGENDEELSDEAEFSDDEKEAEYRKMRKMAKRGADDKKNGNREFIDRKKVQNKSGGWKNNQPSVPPVMGASEESAHVPPMTNNRPVGTNVGSGSGSGSWTQSFGTGQANTAFTPSNSQTAQGNCFNPHPSMSSNGVWANGMLCQQQQNFVYPNGFPMNGVPYQQQHQQHQQMLMGFPNGMPMQQQFGLSQGLPMGSTLPYGQPNFFPGPPTSMPLFMGQPGFNQAQFGMGFHGHQAQPQINGGQQIQSNGPGDEQNHGHNQAQVGTGFQGHHLNNHTNQSGQGQSHEPFDEQNNANFSGQHQFNQGTAPTRGRRPYQRGRGGGHPSRGRGGRGRR